MSDTGDAIARGDFRIRAVTTGRWREHCYVVRHAPSGDCLVVDPGDDADTIAAVATEEGGHVRGVVLTHAHYDHVGALAALCGATGVPCYLHPADMKLLRRAPLYAMSFEQRTLPGPPEGRDVTAAPLSLGGQPLRALHLPGHTPGGMAYALEDFAFIGDTLLFEQTGRVDLPGGDGAEIVGAVTSLLEWLSADTLLLPGHGRPWTVGDARVWWARAAAQAPDDPVLRGQR